MKKLFLIRHAKSSWKNPELEDFDRPLNKRGKNDAPLMAELLKEENMFPDLILTSPAKRAFQTAVIFADILNYSLEKIMLHKRLYEPDVDDFENVLKNITDNINTLFVISHNPGITAFNNYISDKRIDNIPTTGICQIELNIKSWKKISLDCGKILSFDYPKKYK